MTRQRPSPFTRDWFLRLLGAGGFLYLLTQDGAERVTYMLACLALMQVPSVLDLHKKRKDEDG